VEKVLICQGLSEANCHRWQREQAPAGSQRGIFPTVKGWEELSERNFSSFCVPLVKVYPK
jgi:hypothetical protein